MAENIKIMNKNRERMRKKHSLVSELAKNIYLIIICILMLYPMVLMLTMSVKDYEQVINGFFKITFPFNWSNYSEAWVYIKPFMFNSVWYGLVSAFGAAFLATLAGYAFGKLKFIGKNVLFMILFAKMFMPGVLNLVPSYMLAVNLKLTNTPLVIIIFAMASAMPYWVFVMKVFAEGLTKELFEAMRIDGANEFYIFIRLSVPLLVPMIALMSINVFLGVWNDYIWPLVTLTDEKMRTMTIGLYKIKAKFPIKYGVQAAGYTIASIPLLVAFLIAMRPFVDGLTSGSIKM